MKGRWGWLFAGLTVVLVTVLLVERHSIFVVVSESMAPTIRAGDVVVLRPVSRPLRVGDVVSYAHGDKLITHRVIAVNGDELATKGDNTDQQDAWPVTTADVRGLVWLHIPYLGWVIAVLRTPQGWVSLVILPAIVLLVLEVRDLLRTRRKRGDAHSAESVAGGSEP